MQFTRLDPREDIQQLDPGCEIVSACFLALSSRICASEPARRTFQLAEIARYGLRRKCVATCRVMNHSFCVLATWCEEHKQGADIVTRVSTQHESGCGVSCTAKCVAKDVLRDRLRWFTELCVNVPQIQASEVATRTARVSTLPSTCLPSGFFWSMSMIYLR